MEDKDVKPVKLENLDEDDSSTVLRVEFSEVGNPVPFKIIKMEESGQGLDVTYVPEMPSSSSMDCPGLVKRPNQCSSSPVPNKVAKQVPVETVDDYPVMSSDDDDVDDSEEIFNSSDSDTDTEYDNDSNDLGTASKPDTVPSVPPVWTPDPKSMKKIEFTQKQQLLIEPPQEPYDAFRWFLNDELLDVLVDRTNKYAQYVLSKKRITPRSRLQSWKDVTHAEMITFLGLFIHTGTIRLYRLDDYWRGEYLFNFKCFSGFMKRNRFSLLHNFINFGTYDMGCHASFIEKIEPIIKNFNKTMNEIYYPGKELMIAQPMVICNGQLIYKEYPDHRRRGINLFMLADTNGVVLKYKVYSAKSSICTKMTTEDIVENLLREKTGHGHSVYMDKYYNSCNLATKLLNHQTYCTGTLNKKTENNPFRNKHCDMPEQTNQSFFHDGVHVGNWKEDESTLYISTEFGDKLETVIGKNGKMGSKPKALVSYNKYMRGAELQDQLMSYYPCPKKPGSWPRKLFMHLLQIYMSNAYYMYDKYSGCEKLTYYDFRLAVLKKMLPQPAWA